MSTETIFDPRKVMICEESEIKVYKTRDLSMFKEQKGNRVRSFSDVNSLSRAISEKNMLKWNPLLVNGKMEVVDGQTRLKVAKELNEEVYFIIAPDMTVRDTQILNSNMKRWTLDDFIHSHIEGGNDNYLKFRSFCHEWKISTSDGLCAFSLEGQGISKSFKEKGDFIYNQDVADHATDILRTANDFKPYTPAYRTRYFFRAIRQVINIQDYNHKHMMEKLPVFHYHFNQMRGVNHTAYKYALEKIYNSECRGTSLKFLTERELKSLL